MKAVLNALMRLSAISLLSLALLILVPSLLLVGLLYDALLRLSEAVSDSWRAWRERKA